MAQTSMTPASMVSEAAQLGVRMLICYGLVGRWTMIDLQEDRSLVRNMLNLG